MLLLNATFNKIYLIIGLCKTLELPSENEVIIIIIIIIIITCIIIIIYILIIIHIFRQVRAVKVDNLPWETCSPHPPKR